VDTPPIIYGNVENTERDDEECCRPLGFEANGNHNACNKTEQREERASDAPFALENKAEEKEDEEDATREKEIFPAVIFTDARDSSEQFLARHHRVTEYHEKASGDGKVAEEKRHIEDKTITKPLDNDDCEKTSDSVFRMALRYHCTRGNEHGDDIEDEEGMRDSSREVPMLVQIPELVTPLCDDPERILKKSDDDEEATNCWEIGPEGLRVYLHVVLDLLRIVAKLFDRVFWLCGSVAGRGPGITNPMRIRAVTDALWASDTYARGH